MNAIFRRLSWRICGRLIAANQEKDCFGARAPAIEEISAGPCDPAAY
jgi:hypothetical protein